MDDLIKSFDYPSSLDPFVHLIKGNCLLFDKRHHSFRFAQFPVAQLPKEYMRKNLIVSQEYSNIKNHKDKVMIKFKKIIVI